MAPGRRRSGSARSKGPFSKSDYHFAYENLFHTSDDHKDAITAQIGVYDGDQRIDTVYPAKWDFHKGDGQMTTEVAIHVRTAEDVYVVLTGYDLDTNLANFRVYVNPLILWVWVGIIVLLIGVLVCLIPQSVVEMAQWKPRTKIGRAADVGLVVGIALALTMGVASQAHADPPAGANGAAAEHVPAGMGMGKAGGGFAAMNRPTNDTEQRAMKELLCPCGCARQSIFDCDCTTAAQLRAKVQGSPRRVPTSRALTAARTAYAGVLKVFTKDYGAKVLATPTSDSSWLFPSIAAVGALVLLIVAGRRWVARSAHPAVATANGAPVSLSSARRRGVRRQTRRRALGNRLMVFGRGAKIGALILLLLVGWAFVLQSNKFHVTAATVIACLSFLAVVMTVWNLWRTGAAAAGPTSDDAGWGKPMGARGELEKEKKTLLKGIKEAEFDAAMGKLSKADSDSLIREYRARAIEVIKQIEGLGGANLTTREKIEHEVKARIALDLSDKPSNSREEGRQRARGESRCREGEGQRCDEARGRERRERRRS